MTNGQLLWVDDEVEQLKGHIIFLEKNLSVSESLSGESLDSSMAPDMSFAFVCHLSLRQIEKLSKSLIWKT